MSNITDLTENFNMLSCDTIDPNIKQELIKTNNKYCEITKKRHHAFFELRDLLGEYYVYLNNELGDYYTENGISLYDLFFQLGDELHYEYNRLNTNFIDFTTYQYTELNTMINNRYHADIIYNNIYTINEFFDIYDNDINNFYNFYSDKNYKNYYNILQTVSQ